MDLPASQQPRLKSKSKSTNTSFFGASSSGSLYFAVAVGLFLLFGLYYWIKVRPGLACKRKSVLSRKDVLGVPDTTHREPPVSDKAGVASAVPLTAVTPPEKAVTTMYVPRNVGHRTGHQRVFITNKGLRVYETNEYGWPLPPVQAGLNSQTPS